MLKRIALSILLALIYWVPSTLVLFDIITDAGILFSDWMITFLRPGYILGFALGFGGGNWAAMIGQIITLITLSAIIFFIINHKKSA
ncbi:hypothetical protein [Brumimicrobium mesophilum]|uniref:hypothetical protein n=1 Tax=Brumimicrobium mesophilum TaxID=392717 RepID=UPI000D1414DC|nr:hypothetical protein [Brumimicrobium mesophilum]